MGRPVLIFHIFNQPKGADINWITSSSCTSVAAPSFFCPPCPPQPPSSAHQYETSSHVSWGSCLGILDVSLRPCALGSIGRSCLSNSPSRKNFRERNFMISLVVNVLIGPSLTSCNKASIEYTIKWEAFACIVGLGKLGLTLIYVPQSCPSWSASSACLFPICPGKTRQRLEQPKSKSTQPISAQ